MCYVGAKINEVNVQKPVMLEYDNKDTVDVRNSWVIGEEQSIFT